MRLFFTQDESVHVYAGLFTYILCTFSRFRISLVVVSFMLLKTDKIRDKL